MNKVLITLIALLAIIGCKTTPIGPVTNRETHLYSKEFGATEYYNEYAMYGTSEPSWLCVLTYTEVIGGTLESLDAGTHIIYDASAYDWVTDNTGFDHFCWFADRVVIIQDSETELPVFLTAKRHQRPARLFGQN